MLCPDGYGVTEHGFVQRTIKKLRKGTSERTLKCQLAITWVKNLRSRLYWSHSRKSCKKSVRFWRQWRLFSQWQCSCESDVTYHVDSLVSLPLFIENFSNACSARVDLSQRELHLFFSHTQHENRQWLQHRSYLNNNYRRLVSHYFPAVNRFIFAILCNSIIALRYVCISSGLHEDGKS